MSSGRPLRFVSLESLGEDTRPHLRRLGLLLEEGRGEDAHGAVIVEALSGSEIGSAMSLWGLDPQHLIAICVDPTGLPSGCLWLHPLLLESDKALAILQAWLAGSKDDPVQGLLAQISHDMRSPLSVITTAVSLIPKFRHDEVRMARYLTLISESSGVLKGLVNDILDYSKIREGEFAFTESDFHLPQLLQSVTDSQGLLVKDSQEIEVTWNDGGGLPIFVHQDPGRLRQVLTNLMANAVKFTKQGYVRLTASWANGLGRFEVADTGVGMRAEVLERIFLPYQQADASVHSRFGGTGLGLTIARALVAHMGGDIGVTSEFGVGSTFWFTAKLSEVALERPTSIPEVKGRRILLGCADPRPLTEQLAVHNTVVACTTTMALEQALGDEAFDLTIIDLGLGDFKLVGLLTKALNTGTVVVVTSAGQRGDVATCKEIGVRGYLTLPVESRELEVALGLALVTDSSDIVTRYSAKEFLASL